MRAKAAGREPASPSSTTKIVIWPRAELRALGERYLADTRVQRKTTAPFFIDKMPNNWEHVGLIHLILPNARIIDARRHPLGCCLSSFKQNFARGQSFSYALEDLGSHYAGYVELMAHFDAVLPGRVHRVHYERMIADTEAEVRRLTMPEQQLVEIARALGADARILIMDEPTSSLSDKEVDNLFRVIPNEVPILVVIYLVSTRLWTGRFQIVGLGRPPSWTRTILIAVGAAALRIVLGEYVIEPVTNRFWPPAAAPELASGIQGNAQYALLVLLLVWTFAAFGEEISYRGYLLSRASAALGGSNAATEKPLSRKMRAVSPM